MPWTADQILIITRNYPPQTGGLEAYSYELIRQFQKNVTCQEITLRKKKIHLIWFFPYCIIKSIWKVRRNHITFVHLCDGILSPVGILLQYLTSATVSTTIHGLDITYNNRMFQKIIPRLVGRLDKVICPSQSTALECRKRGIPSEKIHVIPNGVRHESVQIAFSREICRKRLEQKIGFLLDGKRVLITVGRLVKRKGVSWFVGNIMPRLPENYIYIVVGEGPERKKIELIIKKYELEKKVFLIGNVSDFYRNLSFKAADLFVMPNIHVSGDVEGFGIVALEAGAAGLPVIASDIQGIKDAVLPQKTGCLVPEKDIAQFVSAIKSMKLKRKAVSAATINDFGWNIVFERYRKVLMVT